MISSHRALLTLFLLCAAVCCASAQTQSEMNAEACDAYKRVDAQLNDAYKQILRDYQGDQTFLDKLKKAQRAWLAYRDAHLDALLDADAYAEQVAS